MAEDRHLVAALNSSAPRAVPRVALSVVPVDVNTDGPRRFTLTTYRELFAKQGLQAMRRPAG